VPARRWRPLHDQVAQRCDPVELGAVPAPERQELLDLVARQRHLVLVEAVGEHVDREVGSALDRGLVHAVDEVLRQRAEMPLGKLPDAPGIVLQCPSPDWLAPAMTAGCTAGATELCGQAVMIPRPAG